ncbi:MAG TPA: alpha-galactosidase, partial [Anaerolineales bacterium]
APLFLWRIRVENPGLQPVQLDRLDLIHLDPRQGRVCLAPDPRSARSNLIFLSNGWQSWSYTSVYSSRDRYRRTRLGFLRLPCEANPGTPLPARPGHFASDMFGVLGDRSSRAGLLAGFLSQRQHFGSLEARLDGPQPSLSMWANGDGACLDPGRSLSTDWACLHFLDLDGPDPFGPYIEAAARENGLAPGDGRRGEKPIPTGWCSWYQFSSEDYTGKVAEADIRLNQQAVAGLRDRLPLEVVQIDDGFEAQIGDWFAFHPAFPQGVATLAAEIRSSGLTPGLWLAPFIVHPRSRLAAKNPDWLLRGRSGRTANAGWLWGAFTAALDLTLPAAQEYVTRVIETAVHEWGFPYLKLDFLYAAALPGRYHDPTRTRAQVLVEGLETIRRAAGPEAILLGCGCPLGPAIGLVDAMRIGADVARRWTPAFNGIETFFNAEPGIPSARNAIQNSLMRVPLHRRWWINDPDCLLLRPTTHLTLPEVQTLAGVIALTGGSLLLSDHLPDLPPDRLRIAQALLPLIGRRPELPGWADAPTPPCLRLDLESAAGAWHLLALFNWDDRPQELSLRLADFNLEPQGEYFAREFWSGQTYRLSGAALRLPEIPAHGTALFAVRPASSDRPLYLGSDLHISQGLEVTQWAFTGKATDTSQSDLTFTLERPGLAQGQIELYLPCPPRQALLNNTRISWDRLSPGHYRFPVQFDRTAHLVIFLSISPDPLTP